MQLFGNLLHPLLNALVGQFRLTVFINRQTDEVIVVRQAFRRFEVVARGRPVANDGCAARFNNVTNGAQRIAEVFCVIFLVAAAKDGYQLTVEVDLFQRREEVVPVALRFAVVPGWDAEQQNIVAFQIFLLLLAMS